MKEKKLRNTKNLSQAVGVSRQTINNWRKREQIQGYLIGGRYYFDLDEILEKAKNLELP